MRGKRIRAAGGVRLLLSVVAACLSLVSASGDVAAQLLVAMPAGGETAENQSSPGFQISIDDSLATSFSDFERHAQRGDWEKAFRSLNEIPAEKRKGMLHASEGMIVPAGHRIWEAIAELPADGREAFRVFFDAKARSLWESVGKPNRKPGDDLETARRVYEEFFLTSVGDDAANYLGDAAFEQGNYHEADRYWKAVLDHHPNSDLGEVRLSVKRAMAVLQMGRMGTFDALLGTISRRFGGETVTLGGESVEPARFLSALRDAQSAAVAAADEGSQTNDANAPRGPLGDDTQTTWRLKYLSDGGKKQLDDAVNTNYWYRNGMETWIPPYTIAGGRIYCNWFGVVFGVDARTGKLLWRNEKFDKVHGQFAQMPNSSANLEQYAIAASDDTVVVLWLNPERLNYWQEPFRLIAYDANTGQEKWNSEKLEPLKEHSFVGVPLIEGSNVLVAAHKRNESKLELKSLRLADGTENWSAELGTAQQTQNRRGNQVMPLPDLQADGQSLYILTNNGALLSFDLRKRELNWALKYGTSADGNSEGMVYYSGEVDTATLLHSYGTLIHHEGILYAKESGERVIHAIDASVPRLLWSRPIAPEAVLVGVDDDYLYVLSRELMAIDRETQALVWARRLPIEGGGLSAVIGDDSVYVCSTRGIYSVARDDGRMRHIFRGEDLGAIGAWIGLVGDRLISVSNTAITAYTVPSGDEAAAPASSNAAPSGSGS